MKNEKVNVRIELIQGGKVLSFDTELSAGSKIDHVAGTIAFRIIGLFQKSKKFGIKLGGFSFARKFDVKLVIAGNEVTGSQVILNGSMQFGLTLQDSEKSVTTFGAFIEELISDVMIGTSQMEIAIGDLLDAIGFKSEEIPAQIEETKE